MRLYGVSSVICACVVGLAWIGLAEKHCDARYMEVKEWLFDLLKKVRLGSSSYITRLI